jgi:site-specific DNA-cytosine methylase
MKAIGIHVFAGGYTTGVKRVMPVEQQLEIHGLGNETVKQRLNIPVVMADDWDEWPQTDAEFAFGNPRCTGFSTTTSIMSHRGPDSPINKDIRDFCHYVVANGIPIAAWESVQGAFTTGRSLLDWLRDELFFPAGYRIAHVLIRAANFGNCQLRRRYFFVAYRKGEFKPKLKVKPAKTVGDVICRMVGLATRGVKLSRKKAEYDGNCYTTLKPEMEATFPYLEQGQSLNELCRDNEEWFSEEFSDLYGATLHRKQSMPFGMMNPKRLAWDKMCPTLTSGASQFVHPIHNRTLTIGELAAIMEWPHIPVGPKPVQQIVKGVCPTIGEWIARQAKDCLSRPDGGERETVFRLEEK